MKTYTLFFYLLVSFLFTSCKGQENETYWKSENVTQIDRKPAWGPILGFMDMVADMQIHLSTKNDTLFFTYPDEKKIKVLELLSLSNRRLESGALLDSIYDIRKERDSLRIKFYFNGREDKDRYVLTFSTIDKQSFLQESQKLKKEKTQLLGMLKPFNVSALDLSIPKPNYFNKNINLDALNPYQVAEILCSNDDGLQASANHSSFNLKSKGNTKYSEYLIQNSAKINFGAGIIGKVNFNNLKLIENDKTNKIDAIILMQKNLTTEEIKYLFKTINSKMGNGKIKEGKGLEDFNYIEISWTDAYKTVKLIINDETENREVFDEVAFNIISKAKKPLNIENVLEQYMSSVKKSKTNITIVSKELTALIKSDEFLQRVGGMPFTVDYNH